MLMRIMLNYRSSVDEETIGKFEKSQRIYTCSDQKKLSGDSCRCLQSHTMMEKKGMLPVVLGGARDSHEY